MQVSVTQDIEKVAAVLKHPDIYPVISQDGDPPPEDFTIPTEGHKYILGEDSKPFGVLISHPFKGGEKLHIQVLPEHRNKAIEFAEKALEKTKGKLYAEIPELYGNVIAFAQGFGFEVTGKKDRNYIKDDVHYFTVCMERKPWAS